MVVELLVVVAVVVVDVVELVHRDVDAVAPMNITYSIQALCFTQKSINFVVLCGDPSQNFTANEYMV